MTTIEAAPAAPEAPEPPRRSHAGAVMLAVAAVFVAVAIVLVAVGLDARSQASNDDDRTAALTAQRDASAKEQRAFDRERERVRELANAVSARTNRLNAALNDSVVAQNAFIDVVNRAADLYNGGDRAAAATVFRTEGAPALATMIDKNTEVQQAFTAARAALAQLRAAK